MTQVAGSWKSTDNGRERKTDGLMKHLGLIDAGAARATDNQNASAGAGLELLHDRPSKTSYIQSLQRDAPITWRDLVIQGANVALNAVGGRVTLPSGTAQSLVAQYFQTSGWSVPTANAWLETDVRAQGTWTGPGTTLRIEYAVTISIPTVGQTCYVGLGVDGALNWPSVGFAHAALAGQNITVSGVIYHTTPPAGLHRVGVWVYASMVGIVLISSIYASLWVTEQRC